MEIYSDVDAIEVESVNSDGNFDHQMDALSSCSAISMAEKSDHSDLEDAGMAPPAALPLNDFEVDSDSLNYSTQALRTSVTSVNLVHGNSLLQPSFTATHTNAAKWKEQNSASFDA
jgi:hypothetical protein